MRISPHTLFPKVRPGAAIETISYNGVKKEVIRGSYDFARTYDPVKVYLTDYKNAPHLDLANCKATADGAQAFVQHWGPLRFNLFEPNSEFPELEDEAWIRERIFQLSHKEKWRLPPVKIEEPAQFRQPVNSFIHAQKRIRGILKMWRLLRSMDLNKLPSALAEWSRQMSPLESDVGEHEAEVIAKVLKRRSDSLLLQAAAFVLHNRFTWTGFGNPFVPCLELIEEDNMPCGFRAAFHLKDLIDAIYWMIYADMVKGQALIDCAGCGKSFVAKKSIQKCCSKHCTWRVNSKRTYDKKNKS